MIKCSICGVEILDDDAVQTHAGNWICPVCAKGYQECSDCGGLYPKEVLVEVFDGDMICPTCISDDYVTCHECGVSVYTDDATEVNGGNYVCPACLDEKYASCEVCGDYFPVDDLTEVASGDLVCDNCLEDHYTQCEDCSEYHRTRSMITVNTGRQICENCYYDNYFTCQSCGEVYHNDNYGGNGLCEECYREDSGTIHHYHYKPTPNFHGKKGPFYGIELETDKFPSIYDAAGDLEDPQEEDYWMEEDGSLQDGIEFVFHPRTVNSWKKYQDTLDKLTSDIKDLGGRSFNTNTCGIHVHRSRKGLTDMHITKLITSFIKMRSQIEKIAQRRSEEWASFEFLENSVNGKCKLVYKTLKKGWYNNSRYVALNLTNKNTIEFRIFKGTLATKTIMAYILFSHYIVEWAKNKPILSMVQDTGSVLWDDFKKYLTGAGPNGKELLEYIAKKGV